MDPALAALLTETVTQEAYVSQDAYGVPTYGGAITRPARVDWRAQQFVTQTGQERTSLAVVYLDGTPTMHLQDRLTLPDGVPYPIQRLAVLTDETGLVHHFECFL